MRHISAAPKLHTIAGIRNHRSTLDTCNSPAGRTHHPLPPHPFPVRSPICPRSNAIIHKNPRDTHTTRSSIEVLMRSIHSYSTA